MIELNKEYTYSQICEIVGWKYYSGGNGKKAQISCQYYLPFCDCTQNAGTKGFINRGILKIDNIFQKIKTADFTPNPNPLCNWCEYCKTNPDAQGKEKYLCPYFSHWDRNTRNKADINNVKYNLAYRFLSFT